MIKRSRFAYDRAPYFVRRSHYARPLARTANTCDRIGHGAGVPEHAVRDVAVGYRVRGGYPGRYRYRDARSFARNSGFDGRQPKFPAGLRRVKSESPKTSTCSVALGRTVALLAYDVISIDSDSISRVFRDSRRILFFKCVCLH